MALRRVDHPEPQRLAAAAGRGTSWLLGMQSKDGGWGAFDADNTRELTYELPFCDFGAVIDPPSADVTAHVVEMLAGEGLAADPRCRRGQAWLQRAQEPDGSWFGRWGANYVYGTGAAVPATVAAGTHVRRSACAPPSAGSKHTRTWMAAGEKTCAPTTTPAGWSGRGASTASQTAWALLALLAAGEHGSRGDRARHRLSSPIARRPKGPGTSPTTPAPAFPVTSTSTTTCTGSSSHCRRWADT